jgi:hypothetical protein
MLKISYFCVFYSQIYLNFLVNDHHFSDIKKLGKNSFILLTPRKEIDKFKTMLCKYEVLKLAQIYQYIIFFKLGEFLKKIQASIFFFKSFCQYMYIDSSSFLFFSMGMYLLIFNIKLMTWYVQGLNINSTCLELIYLMTH